MIHIRTESAEETWQLGRWIGQRLVPGSVVGLDGDLGAGKTWMAKGLVRGLGDCDDEIVKSPAFNLVHQYEVAGESGSRSVVHIDFYRLDELSDSDFFLFSEYFESPEAVCLVEWAEKFLAQLVPGYLSVVLAVCGGEDPQGGDTTCRDIRFATIGESGLYDDLLKDLAHHAHADS